MDLVFDTNILFSALLGGRVSRVFARAVISLDLHTVDALVEEIKNNMSKLARYTTLTRETLETVINEILTEDVTLHSVEEVPESVREVAWRLVHNVDPDDRPFVALAMHLGVPLWTGDKRLIRLAVETEFRYFTAIDTEGVEMLLVGASLEEVRERMKEKYGDGI